VRRILPFVAIAMTFGLLMLYSSCSVNIWDPYARPVDRELQESAQAFGVTVTPLSVAVNKEGRVVLTVKLANESDKVVTGIVVSARQDAALEIRVGPGQTVEQDVTLAKREEYYDYIYPRIRIVFESNPDISSVTFGPWDIRAPSATGG